MYRDLRLACPACSERLVALEVPVPVQGCRACGGLWLGPDAAARVLHGTADDTLRAIESAATGNAAGVKRGPADPARIRPCPECAQPMDRFPVLETEIDSCPTHGTWLDRNELQEIVAGVAQARRAELAISPDDDVSLEGVLDTAQVIVVGGIKHTWRAFVALIQALPQRHPAYCSCATCRGI